MKIEIEVKIRSLFCHRSKHRHFTDFSVKMDLGPHENKHWGTKTSFLESYYSRRNARLDPNAEYGHADRAWRKRYMDAQKFSANDHALDLER